MPLRSVSMLSVWILSLTVLVTPRRESTISSIYVSTIPRSCPSTILIWTYSWSAGVTPNPSTHVQVSCLRHYVTPWISHQQLVNVPISYCQVRHKSQHGNLLQQYIHNQINGMQRPQTLKHKPNQFETEQIFFQDQAQLASWSGHCNANRFTIFFVSFPVPFFVNVSSRPTWSQHLKKTTPTQKLSIAKFSYKILNPKAAEAEKDPMKVAQVILEASGLDTESYRLGNTKAWVPTDYLIFLYHKYLWSCDVCAPENVFLYIIFLCWPLFLDVTLCLVNRGKTSMIMTNPLVFPPRLLYNTARSDIPFPTPTCEFQLNHWIRIQQIFT